MAKRIGPAGGVVASTDGRVTVTVPAGALDSETNISIQPISNTAAGGLGAAYRLLPAGQHFAQPVAISFPYDDADVEGSAPEALGVAFQDERHAWEWQQGVEVDPAAKRLTVRSTHFSDWSKLQGLQLKPGKATVKVNGRVEFVATTCLERADGDVVYLTFQCGDVTDELASLVSVKAATWSVDGIAGGSAATGTVKGNKGSATFTAPAKKPAGPSVAVSVEAAIRGRKILLVANVKIFGGYRVVGSVKLTHTLMVCAGAFSAVVTDSLQFTLTPNDRGSFTVGDIKNSPTKYTPPAPPAPELVPRVISRPDIFFAQHGGAEFDPSASLMTVGLDGTTTIGACSFGGPVVGTGATEDSHTGFSFYTNKFVAGEQKNIPEDASDHDQPWLWTVTEQ